MRTEQRPVLSPLSGTVFVVLLVMVVLTTSYRKGSHFLVSNTSEPTSALTGLPNPDLVVGVQLQCKATPLIEEFTKYTDMPTEKLPEWFQLKLRLNSSQAGIFPFPKVFESAEEGPLTRLTLKPEFRLRIQHDSEDAMFSLGSTDSVFRRFCDTAKISTHIHDANITTTPVEDIFISFSPESLLASTDAMKDVLRKRSAESRLNAAYIDDEMYKLTINARGQVFVEVHALRTPLGATAVHQGVVNALSTLDQLLHQTVPLKLPLSVLDWPDNHWRGLLLDVSRHFFPLSLLKRCITAMSASKFDTLHLHITDSQSFPLLLEDTATLKLSDLAYQGAFSREKMYTLQDMRELVLFATSYGVEIIPEIDMPAHTLSWGKAFSDIIINCSTVANRAETPHNIYPLDPSNPRTYTIIQEVLRQVSSVFPTKYLHIGGDEVEERCWSESEHLSKWALSNNVSMHRITAYFEQRVVDIAYDLGKVPILWQGILDSHSMPPIPFQKNITSSDSSSGNSNRKLHTINATNTQTTHTTHTTTTTTPTTTTTHTTITTTPPLAEPALVQPWKCWGGLAMRTAIQSLHSGHPVVMSACWYLDYNQEWSSYLAVDLTASARGSVVGKTSGGSGGKHRRARGHRRLSNSSSGSGTSSGGSISASNLRTHTHSSNTDTTTATIDATNTSTTSTVDIHTLLTPAERLYLALTDLEDEPDLNNNGDNNNTTNTEDSLPNPSRPLHSNYFIPGGEAAMWVERVDCSNLECRLWPRAGAVAARLWGLGMMYESVSYYGNSNSGGSGGGHANPHRHNSNSGTRNNNVPRSSIRHRMQPSTQVMALDLPQTVQLYTAYIHYRHYLSQVLHMTPSELTFHYPLRCSGDNTSGSSGRGGRGNNGGNGSSGGGGTSGSSGAGDSGDSAVVYNTPHTPQQLALCSAGSKKRSFGMIYSEPIDHPLLALSRVHSLLHAGVEISSNSGHNNQIQDGTFRITGQCLGTPEAVQRPLRTTHVNVVQLNVGDGSTGSRGQEMLKWLQHQANAGVLLVGFCELNNWQELESYTDLYKNKVKMVYRAANAGFAYSHVMVNSQPYNIGLVSARPFTVLTEHGPPHFQRGVLHVYYEHLQLHVFIVHLHAHSSSARGEEAERLLEILRPLLHNNSKFVVMGDFNTLSRHDHRQHEEAGLPALLQRTDQPVLNRLRKKYMDEATGRTVQYAPMDTLLNAGLKDACVESCLLQTSTHAGASAGAGSGNQTDSALPTWSMGSTDLFSRCMQVHCAATEPTLYNPEWPLHNDSHPYIRLDYILLSPAVVNLSYLASSGNGTVTTHNTHTTSTTSSTSATSGGTTTAATYSGSSTVLNKALNAIQAGVDVSNITNVISDHYPVYTSWVDGTVAGVELY